MAILSILGTSLMIVLRGGVKTWRRGEARRESFEVAQVVFAQLREDLEGATIETHQPASSKPVESRFVCDGDPQGRQRLSLVRTIKAELEGPLTGNAGRIVGTGARIDLRGDVKELEQGRLRAPGGFAEVAWVVGTDQDETLYRGFRTPVGDKHSFLNGDASFWLSPPAGAAAPKAQPLANGLAICRPIASRVAYLGLLFWTPYTNTWSQETPALRWRKAGEKWSGPLDYWDSTRAILKPEGKDHRRFDTFLDGASLANPDDDMLPERVRVTLVLREADAAESNTFLTRDLPAEGSTLEVLELERIPRESSWVRVEKEWIRLEGVEYGRIKIAERGGRGSRRADHKAAAEVLIGRTFEAVIDLPAAREDWGDR